MGIHLIIVGAVALLIFMSKRTTTSDNSPSSAADSIAIQQMVIDTANRFGLDPTLMQAQATAESGMRQFDSNGNVLRSKAGALGVFQLLPSTAQDLGVDPYDTAQNIDGGCRYMAQLLGKYGGDVSLALAAYNAGMGNVDKYGGVPPFPETQAYVAKILSLQQGFVNA